MCRLWVGGTMPWLLITPMRQRSRLLPERFPRFLAIVAMVIGIPKHFVPVINLVFPGPRLWTIDGEALQLVSWMKY